MKYVLDANVALRWVISEPHSDKAAALRDGFQRGMHELLATDFFPYEVANALTRAERRRVIPQGQASVLLDDVLADCPYLHDVFPLLTKATDLASQARASIYDCLYLALAEEHDCPFVTADRKLLNAFPNESRIIELSTL
jgi:predicted nucleic acid-binding protein